MCLYLHAHRPKLARDIIFVRFYCDRFFFFFFVSYINVQSHVENINLYEQRSRILFEIISTRTRNGDNAFKIKANNKNRPSVFVHVTFSSRGRCRVPVGFAIMWTFYEFTTKTTAETISDGSSIIVILYINVHKTHGYKPFIIKIYPPVVYVIS